MRVGILGSGLMGGKLGTIFARAGHKVVFSYARSNEKLKKLAREAQGNARAGTPGEAIKEADAVLLAVHWSRIDDVLKQAGDLSGKVILTCSLPMDAGNTKLAGARRGESRGGAGGECRGEVSGADYDAQENPHHRRSGPCPLSSHALRSRPEFPDWCRVPGPTIRDEASAPRCKDRDAAANACPAGIPRTSRSSIPGSFERCARFRDIAQCWVSI